MVGSVSRTLRQIFSLNHCGRIPPNCIFEVDDLEKEWLWASDSFDLVHVRFMFLAIRDYPKMLKEAMR